MLGHLTILVLVHIVTCYPPCLTLKVHPVVSVLATHGETVLVVHIVGLPLVPALKAPWVTASPLPGALSYGQETVMTFNNKSLDHLTEIVHSSKPVAACVVAIN